MDSKLEDDSVDHALILWTNMLICTSFCVLIFLLLQVKSSSLVSLFCFNFQLFFYQTAIPKTSKGSLDALDSRPHKINNKISITTANVTNGQIMSKVEYKNHNNNQIAIAMQLRHSTRHGAAAPGYCDKEEGNSFYSTIIYEAIVQSGFGATKIIHVPPKIVQNWRSFAFVVGLQAIGECFSFQ